MAKLKRGFEDPFSIDRREDVEVARTPTQAVNDTERVDDRQQAESQPDASPTGGVGDELAEQEPKVPVVASPPPDEPAPAEPSARKPTAKRPARTKTGPAPEPQSTIPPLFVRVSATDDDWLREVRYRQRMPSAALVRALIRLASEDEKLLDRALVRARSDREAERPGPRTGHPDR